MYFTLSWDHDSKQLRTHNKYVDQADKTSRDSQTQEKCLIDPTGQYMALQLFDGTVTILPMISKGKKKTPSQNLNIGEPVPTRITEFFIRASAFLYCQDEIEQPPTMAILYEDNDSNPHLSYKTLRYSSGGAGEPPSAALETAGARDKLDLGASHVIPVPAPAPETSISYFPPTNGASLIEPLKEPAIFVAWAQVDAQRWLLADDYGNMFFLMLIVENERVKGWKLDHLGNTSRASTLVYLDSGMVFVGSHQGDSQLVQIQDDGQLQILQNLANVAPILDFTIMDMGNRSGEGQSNEYSSGQARIVTGSGAFQDGSLRSMRSGVGMEDLGSIEGMENISRLFGLKSIDATTKSDILVAAFPNDTRVFQFFPDRSPDETIEEKHELGELSLAEETVYMANLIGNRLLQVTPSKALIVDSVSGAVTAKWSPQDTRTITAASANSDHLMVSTGGSEAITLDIKQNLRVIAARDFSQDGQIACLDVPARVRNIGIAGFWQNSAVAVLNIGTLETIHRVIMSEDRVTVPRSLVLTQLLAKEPPTLLVALANGEVVTFSYDVKSHVLRDRKAIILGTQAASFNVLRGTGDLDKVFAICEHASLIYGSESRIIYSAVTVEDVCCVCPFDSAIYPGSIVAATSTDLRFALLDAERTTHVQTLQLNETVRRVAYSINLKAFGMGTIQRLLRGENEETVRSSFRLCDEVMFKQLCEFALEEDELVESCIRADLRDGTGEFVERFVVGTAHMNETKHDIARGRILVFAVTRERTLKLDVDHTVKGACRALGVVDGNIVAALVKTVVIYGLNGPSLSKLASYRTSTAPIALSITGNQIAVADLMKSVSIVAYGRPTSPGGSYSLLEVARHFATGWCTAVACVAENTWLESDSDGNLIVLTQNVGGMSEDDRRRLEVTGEFRLGEMVNKIQVVDVDASPNAVVTPKAFLGTVDGSMYLFGNIHPSKQNFLMNLQQAIASRVQSLGQVPFNTYRAFKNSVREGLEPSRFVDADMIENFLDCDAAMQEEICQSTGETIDVKEVRAMVEALRRMH
ncbi:MAG: hypothetical protein Q9174_005194 [Haloplaca sp. 1 TL-2023]